MFAPGAASNIELPLRANRQKNSDVLKTTPIGREIVLTNVKWRQHFIRTKTLQADFVVFLDSLQMTETANGTEHETLHDFGGRLRVKIGRSLILRADISFSPVDGKTALTADLGHAF